MQLDAILQMLRKKSWIILLGAILAPVILQVTSKLSDAPKATAVMELHRTNETGDPDRYVQSQLVVLRGDELAKKVVALVPGSNVSEVTSSTSITQRANTNVIDVTATASTGSRSLQVAAGYVKAYAAQVEESAQAGSVDAAAIDKRLAELTKQLGVVQTRIDAQFDTAADETLKNVLLSEYNGLQGYAIANRYGNLARPVMEVLSDAVLVPQPSRAPTKQLAAATVGGALLAAFAVLLMGTARRQPLRSVTEIESVLGAPVQIDLPWSPDAAQNTIVLGLPSSRGYSAALQKACTLLFEVEGETAQLIGVVGAGRGAGCSTTARNIAASLSSVGRTILVDGDLEDHSLTAMFEAEGQPGLGSMLRSSEQRRTCDLRRVVLPVGDDEFKIGFVPADTQEAPVGALNPKVVQTIVGKLSREAAFVVFDLGTLANNPVGALFARRMSRTVFVAQTPCHDAAALARSYEQVLLIDDESNIVRIVNGVQSGGHPRTAPAGG